MKLLVCGGRDFNQPEKLYQVLYKLVASHSITHVIHGDARGADSLAGEWARGAGIQEVRCPANWDRHGKRAGYIRNAAMLELAPDLVVAFPGGRGTDMMVKLAEEAGVEVVHVQ